MRTVALLGLLLVPGLPTTASAQSVSEMRAELARLRAARPEGVPEGTLVSIEYTLDVAERIESRFSEQAAAWKRRAARFLEAVRAGRDPFPELRGRTTVRGYTSPRTINRQGYAVYLPESYDPSRPTGVYLALHGGSSIGNLFLGVVLGNNMDWLTYNLHLYDDYTPRWQSPFIVVAPDGYGQPLWRWTAEMDVLDVIEDVRRHYNVDPDQIILTGLSNGGVGTYAIGMRHAWRFSAVQAIAGAPSWVQYAGGTALPEEMQALRMLSGMHLAENSVNTHFSYYHGRTDTGPMRPHYVEAFQQRMEELGIPNRVTWYDAGHDIHYYVLRHGRGFEPLTKIRRDRRPREVRCLTGDYRANRQHWVTVTRLESFPDIGRVRAVALGGRITVETDKVSAFSLDLRDAPVEGAELTVAVDGAEAFRGPRGQAGHLLHFARTGGRWRNGFPGEDGLVKRPGLSGPIMDAYYDRMVHVYGTAVPENTDELRRAAERGSRGGWVSGLWFYEQQVIADTEVTDAIMRDAHLVLYGTERDNAILNRLWSNLPIRVRGTSVFVGEHEHEGPDLGVRYIYPNPLSPDRYVVVQAGVTPRAVSAGNMLPDFLPDYLVYDRRTTASRQRLVTRGNRPVALGYFDAHWRLPEPSGEGGDDGGVADAGVPAVRLRDAGPDASPWDLSILPIPRPPPRPPRPTEFLAPETDPAGRVARQMAALFSTFYNFRSEIPGGTWRVERDRVWQIRPQQECLDDLERLGVPARLRPAESTPVPTPVEIIGPIDGVWFQSLHEERPLIIACELAARLPVLVEVLKRHGVTGVDVMSAYRDHPRPSFHTMGLALDMGRFWTDRGWISVLGHFLHTPDNVTCRGPAGGRRGRVLLDIACELFETRTFNTILTPNYNEGHRDHFHIDARPHDWRFYLR